MTSADKLKIGLDFHGVITDNPEYFKVFANEALRRGYEIHIISGGPKATIEKFLQQWGIKYTDILPLSIITMPEAVSLFMRTASLRCRISFGIVPRRLIATKTASIFISTIQ